MRVKFTQKFDWPYIDPYCDCKKVVCYLAGWHGDIKKEIAQAAIKAGKAEPYGENVEQVSKAGSDSAAEK